MEQIKSVYTGETTKLVEGCKITGDIRLDNEDIYSKDFDVNIFRKLVNLIRLKV